MKLKNPKLMIACAAGGVVFLSGFMYSILHTGPNHTPTANSGNSGNAIANYDYQSGDTNTEVLDTVAANQKILEADNKALASKNSKLEQQLQQGEASQVAAIKGSLEQQLNQIKNSLQSEASRPHDVGGNQSNPNAGYDINGSNGNTPSSDSLSQSGVIGTVQDIRSAFGSSTPTTSTNRVAAVYAAAEQSNAAPSLPSDNQAQDQANKTKLMYSIPDGATIGSIYMMTATLAEVPVSGRLIAPAWPFKAIIGRQDLAGTNGHMLPSQIAGAIIQGHAVGNMGLGCANLYVEIGRAHV